jgi:hypothetical protein
MMGAFGSFIAMEAKNEFNKALPTILQGAGNVIRSGVDYFLGHNPKIRRNIGHMGYHARTINVAHSRKKRRTIGR